MEELDRWIASGSPTLKISTILTLHRLALDDVHAFAGNFRPSSVAIKGSSHKPISRDDVRRYAEEMIDYITANWDRKLAVHLSAYAMWRLNWIHPFSDGNGRTSRIVSYMILCAKLGYRLPRTKTIREQISENKTPYYDALEKADKAYINGSIDLLEMEQLLEGYLAAQLVEAHERAVGLNSSSGDSAPSGVLKGESRYLAPSNKIVDWIESKPVIIGAIAVIAATIITILYAR